MRCPATFRTSFSVWPTIRVLRGLWALLVLLAPSRLWATEEFQDCSWQVVLNEFSRVGDNVASDRFYEQDLVDKVESIFRTLVDSPIDPSEKYLSFPYYLKINYTCEGQHSEALVRKGHLTGLKPRVLVTFQSSVNFYRWKMKHLQIEMEAAPFRSQGLCPAEELCAMSWYTPMPIRNGSVIVHVDIRSNGLGPFIANKRFFMNINGFLKKDRDNMIKFMVGEELFDLKPEYFENVPSRPVYYTVDQSPVLILGGVPNNKIILLTDTNFKDLSLVELSIESCWVDSSCPKTNFSSTIHDAISTESTLFIRQNQLAYYFTGAYRTLHGSSPGSSSGSWVRVLATECIKRLCPVYFHHNGSEYILALSTGKHEGYIHLGTITGGHVSFEMLPRKGSMCQMILVGSCSIIWAFYVSNEYTFLLLVESKHPSKGTYFTVVRYLLITDEADILYHIPRFIPDAQGLDSLVILGTEAYTTTPMVPKGLFFNAYNSLLFVWGNFLLQSYDTQNYIYLADFPKELSIKYLVNSFRGDMAIVTENEEIWYLLEGSYRMYRLVPSHGWDVHISVQMMQQSSLYAANETMVTLFYEDSDLYQLMYLEDHRGRRLVKRRVPVDQVLMYQQQSHYKLEQQGGHRKLSFTNLCPFEVMHLHIMPGSQFYMRQEYYRVRPPVVLDRLGFHNKVSLAVYQGLVYYLLWLDAKYDKPYADPVHDPTWRWWRDKQQDQDYYLYLKRNWQGVSGVHIDMSGYAKFFSPKSEYQLPRRIFLDKGNLYQFAILLTARGEALRTPTDVASAFLVHSELAVSFMLAHPHCLNAHAKQEVLVNRKSVLFRVLGSSGHCFQNTHFGLRMQGHLMVPVIIGCPPSKRLAFDITYTLKYNFLKNERYSDCLYKDLEMPCFYFRDMFYPFFLIQDLVTGDSRSFNGSYVLKVVGGGPSLDRLRDYSEEEIYRFNSPQDKTRSLIWSTSTIKTTENGAFHIMSPKSLGIHWLCLENSPCYNLDPKGIFAPEFFFKVLVSNRGVDESTYCDYQLVFVLHIHGFPLGSKSIHNLLIMSGGVLIGLVGIYIIICLLWPFMVRAWKVILYKINNAATTETYHSSSTSFHTFSSLTSPQSCPSPQVIFVASSKEQAAPGLMPQKRQQSSPSLLPALIPSLQGPRLLH
ncbi:cation channel sperm-associated auxiliary subunit gamma [Ctenodactylus gundi]